MPRYPNLPGIDLVLVDNQLKVIDNRPRTETVLIVGPAVDGPIDRAVSLQTADVERMYGPMAFNSQYTGPNGETNGRYNGNALVKAFREVQLGGCQSFLFLRVGGALATGTHTNATPGATGTLTYESIYPGRLYNQAAVAFTSGATQGSVTVSQPTIKGGNFTITWNGTSSGITVREVIDLINSDPRNRTVRVAAGTIDTTVAGRLLQGSVTLTGGTDGTVKDDLSSNLYDYYTDLTTADTGAFTLMEEYQPDIVYLAGIYLDDQVADSNTTTSVANAFANWLGKRSLDYPIIGVLGVRPLADFSTRAKIATHFSALSTTAAGNRSTNYLNAGYFMYTGFSYNDGRLEQAIDAGGQLCVVAGDVIFADSTIGSYIDSAAGIFAGAMAAHKSHIPLTHKRVVGIAGIPYKFTEEQLNTLTGGIGASSETGVVGGGAYVTLRQVPGYGVLFTADVTAARRTSDFSTLQNRRIAAYVHRGLHRIAFPYLGGPGDPQHRLALETACKRFLDDAHDQGMLMGKEGVGYQILVEPRGLTMNHVSIDVKIVPPGQIRHIDIRVGLSYSL